MLWCHVPYIFHLILFILFSVNVHKITTIVFRMFAVYSKKLADNNGKIMLCSFGGKIKRTICTFHGAFRSVVLLLLFICVCLCV